MLLDSNPTNSLMLEKLDRVRLKAKKKNAWPERHVIGIDEKPAPFHLAQNLTYDSERRIVALVGGAQLGKTGFLPHWLKREIDRCGKGDYLAVTSSAGLFQKKFLPEFLRVFEGIYELGRFWVGAQIFELKDPETGKYWANRVSDLMWGRVMLLSAQAKGSLESATAKASVLDEAGQDEFTIEAWRAVRRRLNLNHGRILITSTLYGMNWLTTEVVVKALDGGDTRVFELDNDASVEITDNEREGITLVQADSITNPSFPRDEYEEAKRTLPEDLFAMFYRGRLSRPRFMIYDCFDEQRHLIPRFRIPEEWPRIIGLDFGAVNMYAVFAAQDPENGKIYIYRVYHSGKKSANDHVRDILYGEPGRTICYGGAKAEGQWRTEFREAGLPIKEPRISDVWLGINKVYATLKEGSLFIFDDLKDLKAEFLGYRRKTDAAGIPTDEILNKNDYHELDGIRYFLPAIKRDRKFAIAFV